MAITNAQQFKQLVNPSMDGKRPGYRGPGGYQSGKSDDKTGVGTGASVNNAVDTGDLGTEEANVRANIAANLGGSGRADPQESVRNLQRFLNTKKKVNLPTFFGQIFKQPIQKFADFTSKKNRDFFQKVIGAGKLNLGGKTIDLETIGLMDDEELEDTYQDYMSERLAGKIDAYGNPKVQTDGNDAYIFPTSGIMAEASSDMDQESEIDEDEGADLSRRFRANGGSTNDISLEEAKDMAPKGEFLAYINEKEAKMLKDAGGSGIMTNAGIPSFVEYGGQSGFDSAKSTGSVQGDIDRGSGGGPTTNVGGGVTNIPSKKDIPIPNTDFTRFNKQDLINLGFIDPDENKTITVADALTIPTEGKLGLNLVDYSTLKNTGYTDTQISELQNNPSIGIQDVIRDIKGTGFATGGRIGLMEGGMPYEGGIMDLESARQMYGLGKLVKKVTRSVKKIAKSPIGKAAILAAGGYYLGGGNMGPFSKFLPTMKYGNAAGTGFGFSNILPNIFNAAKMPGLAEKAFSMGTTGKIGLGIAGVSALSGLLTPEQEEEAQLIADETGIDIAEIRANPNKYLGRRFRAEGSPKEGEGIMKMASAPTLEDSINEMKEMLARDFFGKPLGNLSDDELLQIDEMLENMSKIEKNSSSIKLAEGGKPEPVAKKTMPLLDMGGKEMDLRAEGGFVPIGRMEKADDVPARLSKNEFVFTADAVRNAGEGDVDKGAEVMYNMMKNLESGGEVSEESQGLEGARKMFQTSQRLEEVL